MPCSCSHKVLAAGRLKKSFTRGREIIHANHTECVHPPFELFPEGAFAAEIGKLFPGRKLHLFDTFEGFLKEDLEMDRKMGLIGNPGRISGFFKRVLHNNYKKTSIKDVLGLMASPDDCIVRKGRFPETAVGAKLLSLSL